MLKFLICIERFVVEKPMKARNENKQTGKNVGKREGPTHDWL